MKHILELKQQIEAVIRTTLDEYEITTLEWEQSRDNLSDLEVNQPLVIQSNPYEDEHERMMDLSMSSDIISLQTGERIFFRVGTNPQDNTVICWGCPSASITMETRRLIELLIRNNKSLDREHKVSMLDSDMDQQLIALGRWLQEQIRVYSSPDNTAKLPDPFNTFDEFQKEKVLFLLQGETPNSQRVDSKVLNKLLESYFGEEVTLIPLGAQEWLFMSDETVVTGEADEDTAEARKDSLHAFCSGLYELVASEFAGVFHLSASLPCTPKHALVQMAALLQESIHLGRSFHVTQHIHLPWELQLEQLVASISEQQRLRFIQEIGKGTLLFNDSETLATLETFFNLDCNVSETAKRLFIHRNTLVYRLDKIKQEIGYDVRHFKSANIVQLLLLMYKVTKKI